MPVTHTEIIVRKEGVEVLRKTVPPGDYVLGRAPDCDFSVQGELVSRHHARLNVSDGDPVIEDLGSSNGTFLDGEAITTPTRLAPTQKVQIGTVTIEFRPLAPQRNGAEDGPAEDAQNACPMAKPAPRFASGATPFSPGPIWPSEPGTPGIAEAEVIRRNLSLEDRKAQHLDVETEIARGGMGVVFTARESATRRTVAMKVMYEERDADTAARFIEEAQVTAQLEHPNIVPIYDLGMDAAGQPFYTMKFVQGITLKKVLEVIGKGVAETVSKYPLANLLTIFQKICDALAYAHSKGVIHRDLKPANIMLGKYGEVMVMDWGLAKIVDKRKNVAASGLRPANFEHTVFVARGVNVEGVSTVAGSIMGTPQYMSPEQAGGEIHNLDARSDIFTLGIILYELLTLEVPFTGNAAGEIAAAVEADQYIPPAARVASLPASERPRHLPDGKVPPSLDAIVRKAMAHGAAQRYQSVPELQADLIAYQTGFATTAEKAGFGKQVVLLIKRHRGIFATATSAWLIVTVLIGWFVVKVTQERNLAEHALAVLKSTGPALIAQAQTLVEQQKLEEAITKVDLALQTEPLNQEYHLLRAQLLQASLKLGDAVTEFRRVLDLGPNDSAKANLELCNMILQSTPPNQEPNSAALHLLVEKLNSEGRIAQAVQLATRIGSSQKAVSGLIQNRLEAWRKLVNFDKIKETERITNGGKSVNASSLPLKDLEWVRGLPVETLNIDHTQISDLSPLKGLQLKELRAPSSAVADLSPLRGMPLHLLTLNECKEITDFSPLDGLPLDTFEATNTSLHDLSFLQKSPIKSLSVTGTGIRSLAFLAGKPCTRIIVSNCRELADISALRGMPLRELSLDNCASVADVAVLATCADLEKVTLPRGAHNIEALRSLKKVRTIGYSSSDQKSPEEFWAQLYPDDEQLKPKIALLQRTREALAACGLATHETWRVKLLEDGTLDIMATTADIKTVEPLCELPVSILDLKSSSITDLRSVAKMPKLRRLRIDYLQVKDLSPLAACRQLELLYASYTGVTDLAPLHGLPLIALDVTSTQIRDLSPLAGMPLRVLHVDRTNPADAHPLLSCRSLEWLGINREVPHLTELRALPKLSRIAYEWTILDKPDLDPYHAQPQKTAAEYWAEFDASKSKSGGK